MTSAAAHTMAGTTPSPRRDAISSNALAASEGTCLFRADEAILKGIMETEREVSMLAVPSHDSFASLIELAQTEVVAELLQNHGTVLQTTPSAQRCLQVAMRAARAGDSALVMVSNDAIEQTLNELAEASAMQLSSSVGLCIILEDDPHRCPATCPRMTAIRLGLACIEPSDVSQLRDSVDHAMRLSRAGACPIVIVVHHSILRSVSTLPARPNRVTNLIDMPLLKRRRRQRLSEAGGVLRMARRLELNALRAMPSPGERVSVGFITVGPADAALKHLTQILRLHGRVPALHLGVLGPLDESVLERFLTRCQRVVVLEARPGRVESLILASAESMRQRGLSPAMIWGRTVPTDGPASTTRMTRPDEHLHPSTLARNIVHLLHPLRPTLQVASRLMPIPPDVPIVLPQRGSDIGEAAAMAVVRRLLADVDQRLKSHEGEQDSAPITALAIDGAHARGSADRIVSVELWTAASFRTAGVAAMMHAASAHQPAMFLVLDMTADGAGSIERLVRANITSELAERVVVTTARLPQRNDLREQMQQAALNDACTILIVRDDASPQYSLPLIERELSEIDRLGFEPRQWLIRPAEQVCEIRPVSSVHDAALAERISSNVGKALVTSDVDELTYLGESQQRDSIMRHSFTAEKLTRRESSRVRMKVQPLIEQVQVLRTRPPAWVWRSKSRARLDLPSPFHAKQSAWRVHLAGYRGQPLGLAARVLCDAGRAMGYDVSARFDPALIGAGRRAWTQVLFTHSPNQESQNPLSAVVPFGEADVLLGLDWKEALRAISPNDGLCVAHHDRTHAIINSGMFDADSSFASILADRTTLERAIGAVTHDQLGIVEDFASACRMWLYTDRVTDLAMLGAAFQHGLVPVRYDAIEAALRRLESSGFGRSLEAFEFGRWLTADARLLTRPRDEVDEELHRVTRRMVLSVRSTRLGGRTRAKRFQLLVEQCLTSMPGLSETTPGRQARRDLVAGLYRCLEWGGMDYAMRYGTLLMDLYRVDRGDKGRLVTRCAVLPLAEAMLVRDQVYVACMAASPEQRRRFRLLLNVKQSRGDEVERRYLTRLELIAFRRRLRADIRTSDWPARMAKASRSLLPHSWRGTRRDRELRAYMIDFVQRARHGIDRDYDLWSDAMQRLHHHAVERRLRSMAVSEIRMLAEPASQPAGSQDASMTGSE